MTTPNRSRRTFGAIRKLPSGRYQASYIGPDGRRHPAPSTFTAKVDADSWIARQSNAVQTQTWQPPRPRIEPSTFGEYAEAWIADRRLRPTTRALYRSLLDRLILPTFGDATLRAITPAAVRTWHANVKTGDTSRAHAYALLRTILATAVEDEAIPTNPCRVKGGSKVVRSKDIKPATIDQLAAVEAAMPERLRLIVPLAAWCALRFGEVTELRRRDVDLDAGILRIRRGVTRPGGVVTVGEPKTAAGSRDVSIPPHVLPAVKQHLRDHAQIGPEGLLFYGLRGGQLAHSSLMYRFQRASAAAGRPDLTPHALRHTGAVLAAQSGATIAELMARLGHTTPEMAMRYQHASADRDAVIARKLSDLANGG